MHQVKIESNTGQRVGASLIDYIIVVGFSFWFIMTFGEPNEEGGKTVQGFPALIPMIFWFCWFVLSERIFSKTLGHAVCGLKVISMDGSKPSFGQVLKRRLCDVVEISWCLGLIAFILVKNTQYRQRLGDIWAKTLVVDK